MITGYRRSLFVLGLLACATEGNAQDRWDFEIGITVPDNVPLPLVIRQSGRPDLSLTASYSSRPLEIPVCWIWRISRWSGDAGWELQAVHHKLFLENTPPEVGEFSVSHGLNLITANRSWRLGEFVARIGAGIALSHPENTVRGRRLREDRGIFGMGYYVGGPALTVGVGTSYTLPGNLFFSYEGMMSGSYSNVPVDGGSADVWNVALHANFAVGYSPGEKRRIPPRAGN